jgi:lysophospholipase L1-like esterase
VGGGPQETSPSVIAGRATQHGSTRQRRLSFWLHGPLLPLLLLQGRRTRAQIPLLPEASGARRGTVPGGAARRSLAVLGESTAVGVGAATQDEALAFCLARALARTRGCSFDVQVVGQSGANAARVRRELLPQVELPVDAILVVLGVNDTLELTRGARWRAELDALSSALEGRARHVVFSGVPALGELRALPQPMRSALGARAGYLDALLARACVAHGARHVPIHLAYRPEQIALDGFHPSALGYAAWAEQLARAWPEP